MNGKSTVFKFMVMVLLAVIICYQAMLIKQSDRLFERFNMLDARISEGVLSSGSTTSSADSAKDGDWLIWRIAAEPPTLNPITSKDLYADIICGVRTCNVFETLVKRDPKTLKYGPSLAKSWEISQDGLTLTFTLRPDVTFSDGTPVTTDDVQFTFDTIMDLGIDCADKRNYYYDIDSYEKIDARTIVFRMKRPYFMAFMTIGETAILPKHIYKYDDPSEFNKKISNPVGSGPYCFERWDVGNQIVLKRNENYWGTKVHFRKLIYKVITNDMAALNALKAHEIDVMGALPEQYSTNAKDPKFLKDFNAIKFLPPRSDYTYVSWNLHTPYFKEAKVRRAMTHLIDREAIKDHIWEGLVSITTGPFAPASPQANPNIKPWPFSIEEAARLLDEAGWKDSNGDGVRDKNIDGKKVEFKFKLMTVSGSPITEQMAKVMKDQMAKVGVLMGIDAYEWSIFLDRLHNRKFDATTLAWSGEVENDPYQIWHSSQTAEGGSNYIFYENSEVDSLIENARKTLDEDKRNAMYHRFQEILHEEQPYTFMFVRPSLVFMDKRIENVNYYKLGVKMHEWYVPKEKQRY
ncbi:MAG: peptide-binding protein [Phycisphaerae bacterium]|jgi:peptide/nickel transport system substrate-binding protein